MGPFLLKVFNPTALKEHCSTISHPSAELKGLYDGDVSSFLKSRLDKLMQGSNYGCGMINVKSGRAGHSMAWEYTSGKLSWFNPQTGNAIEDHWIERLNNDLINGIMLMRLDDVPIINAKELSRLLVK